MYSISVPNVNHALPYGLALLRDRGVPIAPRGKSTLEFPTAVATTYEQPWQMVLFDPKRDANPFFHFFEALWILEGRSDVKFLAEFNKNMANYSDDGVEFHAPYGCRLRYQFAVDQIDSAVSKLMKDPDTRQVVMSIWDPDRDWMPSKDIPCNDMVLLKVRDGKLRMTVMNRSNDIVWGAYGANVVQFSTLLCYMAARTGYNVGTYTQVSDSYHVYTDLPFWTAWLEEHQTAGHIESVYDPYLDGSVNGNSIMDHKGEFHTGHFDKDLTEFFKLYDIHGSLTGVLDNRDAFCTRYFKDIVLPMLSTFCKWKEGLPDAANAISLDVQATDWRRAVQQWMERRVARVAGA